MGLDFGELVRYLTQVERLSVRLSYLSEIVFYGK